MTAAPMWPDAPMSPELFPEVSPGPSLRELQHQCMREILYRDSAGLVPQILQNGRSADRRLAVYRTNVRENFAQALDAAFPLLARAAGREEFRRLAWSYQRACPSTAGNLFHLGARLPAFLAGHLRGTEDEYFIDVARLEWAVQESLVAVDGPAALNLAALGQVPVERQSCIRFLLHPSVRLLQTGYAVFGLWEALQGGQPVPPATAEPECLLVRRLATGTQLQRLSADDFAWLSVLQEMGTLTPPADGEVDPGSLLVRWVAAGVITDFILDESLSGPTAGEQPP